jgi:hypothetical protein
VRALAVFCLLALGSLRAELIEGRVVDSNQRGIEGVRVYPDRLRRVTLNFPINESLTDTQGRFRLWVEREDDVLCIEKDRWQRDLVPRAEWRRDLPMHLTPNFHVEKVLVVRMEFGDQPSRSTDGPLRRLLFDRRAGVASVANYLFEVSKGSLVLEEGEWMSLHAAQFKSPHDDSQRAAIADWVIAQIRDKNLGDLDRVNNRSGALKPDGKPDHLWVFIPGAPQSVTANKAHLKPASLLRPLPWNPRERWGAVVMTEETPLGNIAHEAFHAMGEHRVDDLYLGCEDPLTAGIWDLMDTGQYRGWDSSHPGEGPWIEDTGYSPSHPGGWVRSELWYRGAFADTVATLRLKQRDWIGWIAPLVRATNGEPQRVVVPDPAVPGSFWNLEVRRPWGFERGRVGDRFGPGHEGLVVSHVNPELLTEGDPRGPMRVVDAHPRTPEPPAPRFPCGRWDLDDAAFNLGKGENPLGRDGALRFEVIDTDASGRMKVKLSVDGASRKAFSRRKR